MLPAKKVLPSFGAYLGGPVFEQNSSEDKLGNAWSSPRDILKTTCFCCWQEKSRKATYFSINGKGCLAAFWRQNISISA